VSKMHADESLDDTACSGRRRFSHAVARANPQPEGATCSGASGPPSETSPGVTSAGASFREPTIGICNPHLALALAVLHRALEDACGSPRSIVTVHALAFWTAKEGPWAESRATWCDLAGLDPDGAARAAMRHIEAIRAMALPNRRAINIRRSGVGVYVRSGGRIASEAIAERDAEILAALRAGASQRDTAARFGLSKQRISSIARKAKGGKP
jgi:hypothetical protein